MKVPKYDYINYMSWTERRAMYVHSHGRVLLIVQPPENVQQLVDHVGDVYVTDLLSGSSLWVTPGDTVAKQIHDYFGLVPEQAVLNFINS